MHSARLDEQELALQILDIVTLRPEIELCYVGILEKCFEILEGKNAETPQGNSDPVPALLAQVWANQPFMNHEDSDDSSVSVAEEAEHGEDVVAPGAEEAEESDSETEESLVSEESEDLGQKPPRLRLREILFFAEKVEIFKVRYGKL